ncbi:hypothetical protein JNB_15808 [Janibacter sp. HTCC2649]|nr:hypothetical protein JNB_15808 [Janibacter sp. HTCC2649]
MILGVVLMVIGAIWGLQGLGVIGGSAMSGVTLWAVIGPLVVVGGLTLALSGRRKP